MVNKPLKKIIVREQDVMRIIWGSDQNVTASGIAAYGISGLAQSC